MSIEKQRLLHHHKNEEFTAGHVGRHRGTYIDFMRRLRRQARKQMPKGRTGIREDAWRFLRWLSDERCLRVAWDYLAEHGGQAPGLDGLRYCDLPETQIWDSLREVRDAIRSGVYEPAEDRSVEISKGPGRGTRTLSVPGIFDRVVQRAAVEVLQPYLDPLFDRHSFGFRPGRGILDALAYAGHCFRSEGRGVWVTADLRDAFGRIPVPRLLDVVQYYTGAEDLVQFLGRVLGGAQRPGLRQGGPLSPLMLSLYLHHHLDIGWRRLHPDIPLLRYADDLLLMCRTVTEARKAHGDLVELLRPTGMMVKGDRHSDVVTLTAESPAHWLGYQLESRGKKCLAVLIGEKAWVNLAQRLNEARNVPDSPVHAWLTVKGWVASKGPSFPFTNPDEAWGRIADIADGAGFEEIPDRQRVKEWWQRAYARWCRLRRQVRESLSGAE